MQRDVERHTTINSMIGALMAVWTGPVGRTDAGDFTLDQSAFRIDRREVGIAGIVRKQDGDGFPAPGQDVIVVRQRFEPRAPAPKIKSTERIVVIVERCGVEDSACGCYIDATWQPQPRAFLGTGPAEVSSHLIISS